MAQYKYTIEMTFVCGETAKKIEAENIKSFFIDSDYEKNIMPAMYAVLNIDKNFYDEIIKSAKIAIINTNIYKIAVDDKTETKTLTGYRGACYYFVSGDINYNKDIDYTGPNAGRKDVYKEVHLGLIYKECVENNKQTNNTTIVNTTMLNSVMKYMQDKPLLLENFTYNEVISQLIVPPKDSLYKTIVFLNSIKVFYDTPYRFFIEPGCIYLISSSGKAVPKAKEKYKNVTFKIHAITDSKSNKLGMDEDSDNKLYSVDISVLDSHYTIDNDTCKTINTISSIVNPAKSNSLIAGSSIQTSLAKIIKVKNATLNNIIKKVADIKKMVSSTNTCKVILKSDSKTTDVNIASVNANIDIAIQAIKDAPEPPVAGEDGVVPPQDPNVKYMTSTEKQAKITELTKTKKDLLDKQAKMSTMNDDFVKSSNKFIQDLGKTTTNIPGMLNCIHPINIADNIAPLKSLSGVVTKSASINNKFTIDSLLPHSVTANDINSLIASSHSTISGLGLPGLEDVITSVSSSVSAINSAATRINSTIKTYQAFPAKLSSISSTISTQLKSFDKINTNIKSQFINKKTDLSTTPNKNNKSSSNKATSIATAMVAGKVLGSLKSKVLNSSALAEITKDITKIKDISSLGQLGVSKFNMNLNLAGGVSTVTGSKIIKIDNDNANQLKNIKANMENKSNKLTINKNGLDLSVFTINKEYIVKNYDAHSNKDGKFLLNRKVEIFIREDKKFVLNTMLEMHKLADENKTATKATELGKDKKTTDIKK